MRRVVRRRLAALSGVLVFLVLYKVIESVSRPREGTVTRQSVQPDKPDFQPDKPDVRKASDHDGRRSERGFDLLPFNTEEPRLKGLTTEGPAFFLNGFPFRIYGGSLHYFRVPREYWRDRMLKMKACGLNTVTTYVPWNLHEAKPGEFDFSGMLDVRAFIKTAADVGLWVILRPGPYICAEWDLGGLPSWLLRDRAMKFRTTYRGFTAYVETYFYYLMINIGNLQFMSGGPIIAFQVENEYGSYAKDPNYMEFIRLTLLKNGVVEFLMTSDNKEGLSSGRIEGVLATVNFQKKEPNLFSYLDTIQNNMPKMVMEFWTGWFDHWGGDHHVFDAAQMANAVKDIVNEGASINLYMFHGGTNFGFMNGATHFDVYQPLVTSYDYDAPLTEAGEYTSKYYRLRELFSTVHDFPLPIPPSIMPKASYDKVNFNEYISLWDTLDYATGPFYNEQPINMEELPVDLHYGQAYGYTLYEAVIYGGGRFTSEGNIKDRALMFVNNQPMGVLDDYKQDLLIPEVPGHRKMRLLVENCGRINFGTKMDEQRKGLLGEVNLRESPVKAFKMYSLDMNQTYIHLVSSAEWSRPPEDYVGPGFFRGYLNVLFTALDTYLSMTGWKKGVVFVNGRNLGRYWDIGPQNTLYLPGIWLHPGSNEIIIFEEFKGSRTLQSVDTPFLGRLHYVQ